eukprot:TRINITY_DN6335_c0_g1_i1.p1 TRINITY_DN6335_c0_g1~~TRINITY_DN6335_c0_g1_i1.p1  ORF type:complete len:134 (-),score=11.73 TRINITY_DN6335_c0_g1_i1:21-422(-)
MIITDMLSRNISFEVNKHRRRIVIGGEITVQKITAPLEVKIPLNYPIEAPIIYLRLPYKYSSSPTINSSGRVRTAYLARWNMKSSLSSTIKDTQHIFQKDLPPISAGKSNSPSSKRARHRRSCLLYTSDAADE